VRVEDYWQWVILRKFGDIYPRIGLSSAIDRPVPLTILRRVSRHTAGVVTHQARGPGIIGSATKKVNGKANSLIPGRYESSKVDKPSSSDLNWLGLNITRGES